MEASKRARALLVDEPRTQIEADGIHSLEHPLINEIGA
jgi:hypothetical protein